MTKPTENDLGRDLAADLDCHARLEKRLASPGAMELALSEHNDLVHGCCWYVHAAREGWPAAIRRALAAEAELLPLRHAHDQCRDDWQAAIEERDEALERAEAAEAEVRRLQSIITGLTDRVAAQSELLSKRAEK